MARTHRLRSKIWRDESGYWRNDLGRFIASPRRSEPRKKAAPRKPETPKKPAPRKPELPKKPAPRKPELPKKPAPRKPELPKKPVPRKPEPPKKPAPRKSEPSKKPAPRKPELSKKAAPRKPELPKKPAPRKPEPPKKPAPRKPEPPKKPVPRKPELPKKPAPRKLEPSKKAKLRRKKRRKKAAPRKLELSKKAKFRRKKPRKKLRREHRPQQPLVARASREAEVEMQGRLLALLDSIGILQGGLDMAVQTFCNKDGTVDGELRIGNLPAEWRILGGVPMLVATLSNAFRSVTAFDRQPAMGGTYWASFGIRFGPQNEAEVGEMIDLYKRFRGMFQIGTYPTPAWGQGALQVALTGDTVGLRAMISSLQKKRGLPPSAILIRFIWTPEKNRPAHYRGEK